MSLFFYGAIEAKGDESDIESKLISISNELNWQLIINKLQQKYTIKDLFGVPDSREYLVFELNNDVYDTLYNDFDGMAMINHYREVGRNIGIKNYRKLEFGEHVDVDIAYLEQPFDLPIVRFSVLLVKLFGDRELIICLDEGFENQFDCKVIHCDATGISNQLWASIAFGYTWPNIRLHYQYELGVEIVDGK